MAPRRDFRKLDPATQAELRRVAVGMVEAGKTRVEAAAAVGVNRRFVGEWVEAARQFGDAALAGGRRGRRPGEQKALSSRAGAEDQALDHGPVPGPAAAAVCPLDPRGGGRLDRA